MPARIVELTSHEEAVVDLGGVHKTICTLLVPDARIDDYVIVHVGHAIGRLSPSEAERTLALFAELSDLGQRVGEGGKP